MFDACKWQLGVVDWSLWKPTHDVVKDQKEKIINHIPCTLEPNADSVLRDGEIVYICDSGEANYSLDNITFSCLLFHCWVPSILEYFDIIGAAVRPIVSEKDAIEMDMKFNLNLKNLI